jgi:hypothetical protein
VTDTLTVTGDDGREWGFKHTHGVGCFIEIDDEWEWVSNTPTCDLLAEVVRLRASVTDLESKLVRECGATMSWAKEVARLREELAAARGLLASMEKAYTDSPTTNTTQAVEPLPTIPLHSLDGNGEYDIGTVSPKPVTTSAVEPPAPEVQR